MVKKILLYGIGSLQNKGCEALVNSTIAQINPNIDIVAATFDYEHDKNMYKDRINHFVNHFVHTKSYTVLRTILCIILCVFNVHTSIFSTQYIPLKYSSRGSGRSLFNLNEVKFRSSRCISC